MMMRSARVAALALLLAATPALAWKNGLHDAKEPPELTLCYAAIDGPKQSHFTLMYNFQLDEFGILMRFHSWNLSSVLNATLPLDLTFWKQGRVLERTKLFYTVISRNEVVVNNVHPLALVLTAGSDNLRFELGGGDELAVSVNGAERAIEGIMSCVRDNRKRLVKDPVAMTEMTERWSRRNR